MQSAVDLIHELFVGVEALGTQPDLHLGEEMVIAWRQVQTVRRVVENPPVEELDYNICASPGVGPRVFVQEDTFSEHTGHLFGPISEAYSAFHNKPLKLLWFLVP
jgi:hypothetical protein